MITRSMLGSASIANSIQLEILRNTTRFNPEHNQELL